MVLLLLPMQYHKESKLSYYKSVASYKTSLRECDIALSLSIYGIFSFVKFME